MRLGFGPIYTTHDGYPGGKENQDTLQLYDTLITLGELVPLGLELKLATRMT